MKHYSVQPTTSEGPNFVTSGRDPLWEKADALHDFLAPWSSKPPPPMSFRALWNDEALYFRYEVEEKYPVLAEADTLLDRVLGSDRVEIFIATSLDLNPYYCFEMDPRGEVLDFIGRMPQKWDYSWHCEGFHMDTERDDESYIVEGRFDLKTLQELQCLQSSDKGTFLWAGLYRGDFRRNEDSGEVAPNWITWIDPKNDPPSFHVPSSFGRLWLVPE